MGWTQTAKIGGTTTSPDTNTNTTNFGYSVAASGPFVVSLTHEGGAFTHYTPVPAMATMRRPDERGRQEVGAAVAAKGGLLLVGVPGDGNVGVT